MGRTDDDEPETLTVWRCLDESCPTFYSDNHGECPMHPEAGLKRVDVVPLFELEDEWLHADELDGALRTIAGPASTGDPWIPEYQAAGGGYEGLQAIASAALARHRKRRASGEDGSP